MNFTEQTLDKLKNWQIGNLFSMLNESKNDICYEASSCKEYTLDCIFKSFFPEKDQYYTFNYEKTDLNNLNIVVFTIKNINETLGVIHNLEEKLKIKEKSRYCKLKENWYCLQGSADWLIAPPLVSLYTLTIRDGIEYFNKKKYYEPIWDTLPLALDHIIINGIEKIFGTREKSKENWNCVSIHGQGINSFATKLSAIKKKDLIIWNDIVKKCFEEAEALRKLYYK